MTGHARRRFLTYLVAAPVLAVATKIGVDVYAPGSADDLLELLDLLDLLVDLGDLLILAGKPTADMLVLSVDEDGGVLFRLPREEVGQGLTTAVAMLVAEELDTPLDRVRVQLDDARPELLFNQLTGSSNSVRSLYDPVRRTAAAARARMVAAAARRWGLEAGDLTVRAGVVIAPDGRTASYGSLTTAAATLDPGSLTITPKKASEHTLVGTPTSRIDARALVTGAHPYTLDLDVPGAKPCMVRRPPTINGTVESVDNEAAVRAMPGVLDVVVIDTGVAVVAETFGQALDGKNALEVTWGGGTVDALSDTDIRARLKAATPSLDLLGALVRKVDAEFDFAFASHAPMETNSAVADVRSDSAEIWSGLKSPIVAQAAIAEAVGLPVSRVKVHVMQSGGSFGRRLFFDAALEAAVVSRKSGRPVRLMWSRVDDMRHGRMRPATHHRVRATYAAGQVLTFEHRVAAVETDFRHGLGDAVTAAAASLPTGLGNATFAQTLFLTTVKSPYNFGVTTQTLTEVPLKMHTGSWRSVYSANTRGAEEIVVDELAARLGRIDILVNNAGIAGMNATTWDYPADEWSKVMRVNLDGPFHCCRAAVPIMQRQKYGRIVNIASVAGKEGNPNASHYSASKAGLIGLTKSLGKELATKNILVNAVTPAAAKTEIFDSMKQEHIDYMLSKIPMNRFLLPDEAASLILWLASEDCAFSTGAVFDLSGGRATY